MYFKSWKIRLIAKILNEFCPDGIVSQLEDSHIIEIIILFIFYEKVSLVARTLQTLFTFLFTIFKLGSLECNGN